MLVGTEDIFFVGVFFGNVTTLYSRWQYILIEQFFCLKRNIKSFMGQSEIKTDALWDSFSYIDYYEKVLL